MPTKYIHCRNFKKDGTMIPQGGMTVAYTLDDKFKVVGMAVAKCHSKDMYNKQVGRMKASGRLLSDKYYQDVPESDEMVFIANVQEEYKKTVKTLGM